MTSSSINAPTETISHGIFIQALSAGQLNISCNWCAFSAYRGEDIDHPDVGLAANHDRALSVGASQTFHLTFPSWMCYSQDVQTTLGV